LSNKGNFSGLNLATAAIVLWNTVYLEGTVGALRKHGSGIHKTLLEYLSPLGWEYINLTGITSGTTIPAYATGHTQSLIDRNHHGFIKNNGFDNLRAGGNRSAVRSA